MASPGILFTIARSLIWGQPCGFLGVSLAPGFSLIPKCALIKMSLSLLSPSVLSPVHPICSFKFLSLHSSCPKFILEISSISPSQGHPCIPLWALFVIHPLQRLWYWRLVILYFTPYIYLWVSTYHVCLSGSGLPHSECLFSSSIYFTEKFMRSFFFTPE